MKKFFAMMLALLMVLSLTACGQKPAETTAPAAPSTTKAADETKAPETQGSSEPIEVVWWTYFGDTNVGYLQEIIDRFNASQTKYHAVIEYQGNQAEMNAKIGATAQSELPALFSGAVENVAMYAASEYCAPLQQFIDADTDGWKELDETWGALRSSYEDNAGNLVGYPVGYSYPGIFYNADMLDAAGIKAEDISSMDALYEACKTLVTGGHTTFGVGFHPDGFYFNAILGREGLQAYDNGNGYDGDITTCLYMDDEKVHDTIYSMLSNYQKLYVDNYAVPYGASYQGEIIPMIASGECAMLMGVVSMTTKVLSSVNGAFNVGIMPLPSVTADGLRSGEPAGGTGTFVCNNGNLEQMQGGYELIKFMSTGDEAAFFATKTGYLAPNQSAYDSALYQDYMTNVFPAIAAVYDSLSASDSSAKNPYIPISNEMKQANVLCIQTVTGDTSADIDDAMQIACDTIQEAIELYNAANK